MTDAKLRTISEMVVTAVFAVFAANGLWWVSATLVFAIWIERRK